MSKLSFRARALDANKSLPVFHEQDVPDLPDIASVNRVVPQMPTGMEKEEETEHHLQRVISAQQIYGEAQRLIIPTPDAVLAQVNDKLQKKSNVQMPKQFIHVQAFTLEDELPDYDCDAEDLKWIENYNKTASPKVSALEFEKMVDILEKGCSSRLDLFTVNDANVLIKKDEKLVNLLYDYWKTKRTKEKTNLTPTVKTEKKDGSTLHDPYVAFRRRIEKMQTRKNRKNDEASYEKMLKLRRDLNRACLILEMVKLREEKKRDLLRTTMKVLENRYSNKDYNGELLHQCYDILKQRQLQQEPSIINNNNVKSMGTDRVRESLDAAGMKRAELVEEARKRHKLMKQRSQLMSANSAASNTDGTDSHTSTLQQQLQTDTAVPEGPDGKFTFRRKKGVMYHAPRYDSMGNWPWTHSVEGGSADSKYCYCCTSVQKRCCCIGFARRRISRGGRIVFDRAYAPYDSCLAEKPGNISSISPTNGIKSKFSDRVPPWPHFKPLVDSSDDDEEIISRPDSTSNLFIRKDLHDVKSTPSSKPLLYRSFSSQPTSRFRIHPYPSRSSNNNNIQTHSSINNQVFLASLTKSVESQHWILRKSKTTRTQPLNGMLSPNKNNIFQQMNLSPSRPASTAPASAIYQLNFPVSSTATSMKSSAPAISSNIMHRKTPNTVTNVKNVLNSSDSINSTVRSLPNIITVTTQPIVSRQPLSIVQQQSYITQKIIPHQQNNVQLNSLQVQSVNSVRGSKLSISKGLTITHTPVVSNGITTTVPSIQVAR